MKKRTLERIEGVKTVSSYFHCETKKELDEKTYDDDVKMKSRVVGNKKFLTSGGVILAVSPFVALLRPPLYYQIVKSFLYFCVFSCQLEFYSDFSL